MSRISSVKQAASSALDTRLCPSRSLSAKAPANHAQRLTEMFCLYMIALKVGAAGGEAWLGAEQCGWPGRTRSKSRRGHERGQDWIRKRLAQSNRDSVLKGASYVFEQLFFFP